MEHLEKYLTWFTPLVSSIAAIIFAAEKQIDERGPRAEIFFVSGFFYASNYFEAVGKLNVVDFKRRDSENLNVKQNYQLVSSYQAASCPP